MNTNAAEGLVQRLLSLPVFRSEWVLWLLLGLSLLSVAVMVERWFFYRRRKINFEAVKDEFAKDLDKGDFDAAAKLLAKHDSLETNVALAGLRGYEKGPESVEELLAGALSRGKSEYERRLSILATLASNSPFIGLFGTVLGIIRSFKEMSKDIANASTGVMSGIAEALVATAVGLLVAIPAVVAYNVFKGMVNVLSGGVTINHHAFAALAPEQVINRSIERLTFDIPQSYIHRGYCRHGNWATPPIGAAIKILPYVFGLKRIAANNTWNYMVGEITRYR